MAYNIDIILRTRDMVINGYKGLMKKKIFMFINIFILTFMFFNLNVGAQSDYQQYIQAIEVNEHYAEIYNYPAYFRLDEVFYSDGYESYFAIILRHQTPSGLPTVLDLVEYRTGNSIDFKPGTSVTMKEGISWTTTTTTSGDIGLPIVKGLIDVSGKVEYSETRSVTRTEAENITFNYDTGVDKFMDYYGSLENITDYHTCSEVQYGDFMMYVFEYTGPTYYGYPMYPNDKNYYTWIGNEYFSSEVHSVYSVCAVFGS